MRAEIVVTEAGGGTKVKFRTVTSSILEMTVKGETVELYAEDLALVSEFFHQMGGGGR